MPFDIKLSYPGIILPYAGSKIWQFQIQCHIVILYYLILQALWPIVTVSTGIADTHHLLPHLRIPNSSVHNVIITLYIDIIMLFFALLCNIS